MPEGRAQGKVRWERAGEPRPLNRGATLATVCAAFAVVILSFSDVNLALPSMQKDIGVANSVAPWVPGAYALLFGSLLMLGGRAADLYGRRLLFIAGGTILAAGSGLGAIATSSGALIIGRGVQGLGASMVAPTVLAIIMDIFPEGRERDRALGAWGSVAGGGLAAGLLIGGVLSQVASWRLLFWLNVPVLVVVLAMGFRLLPESRDRSAHGVDTAGAIAITGGLLLLVFGLSNAQNAGWGPPITPLMIACAVAFLSAFVAIERHSGSPLMPLSVFRSFAVSASNAVMFLISGTVSAVVLMLSLHVSGVLGYSGVRSGLAFAPFGVVLVVSSYIIPSLVARLGARPVLVAGIVTVGVGLLLLRSFPVQGSYAGSLLPGMLLLGAGVNATMMGGTIVVLGGMGGADQGLGSGLVNMSQQIGAAFGVAVMGSIAAGHTASMTLARASPTPQALAGGFTFAATLLIAAPAAALLIVVRLPETRRPAAAVADW